MQCTYSADGFPPLLHTASSIRLSEATTTISTFLTADILVTCLSIVTLFIYYFALYKPIIRHLDRDIKNVRLLLLLFPDDVSNVVPAIIDAGMVGFSGAAVKAASTLGSTAPDP